MIVEFSGEYRWLSNFSKCEVFLDGITYPSVENAYQASKTLTISERTPFVNYTAHEAKSYGRKLTIRPDWEWYKLGCMLDLIHQKFNQEPYKNNLILTGKISIVEGNTWGDTYWGVCNGVGNNLLGKLIMGSRTNLQDNII